MSINEYSSEAISRSSAYAIQASWSDPVKRRIPSMSYKPYKVISPRAFIAQMTFKENFKCKENLKLFSAFC